MKTIKLNSFAGVRNDLTPERFDIKDLVAAVNIELDETGKPFRRLGWNRLQTGAMHSAWRDGDMAFVVKGGVLQRLLSDLTMQPLFTVSDRVSYVRAVDSVFCADGVGSWEITRTGWRRWGIEVPQGMLVTSGLGSMRAGTYLVTMTYVRGDGSESGTHTYISVDVTQGLQLELPVSVDGDVVSKRIYVSAWNGELPLLVAEVDNSVQTLTISELPATPTVPVRTQLMGPAPAGQLVGVYKGRVYVAENNYLWYSQPYEFGLFKRMENYLGFPTPIKTFAPVSDGIFVGSEDETVFLQGDDPASFARLPKANYGTVLGTEREVPGYYVGEGLPVRAQMWMSTHGVCMGLDGGEFKNLTGGRYILPEGVSHGASLLKVRGGTPHLVITLF